MSRRKGVESTTSNRKSVFLFSTMSLFYFDTPKFRTSTPFSEQNTSFLASDTPKQRKNHPKSDRLRFRFSFYQFLRCNTKISRKWGFSPHFRLVFAYNRLLSTTSKKSPDGRKTACAIVTAQAAFFRKAFSLTTAAQFLGAGKSTIKRAKTKATSVRL